MKYYFLYLFNVAILIFLSIQTSTAQNSKLNKEVYNQKEKIINYSSLNQIEKQKIICANGIKACNLLIKYVEKRDLNSAKKSVKLFDSTVFLISRLKFDSIYAPTETTFNDNKITFIEINSLLTLFSPILDDEYNINTSFSKILQLIHKTCTELDFKKWIIPNKEPLEQVNSLSDGRLISLPRNSLLPIYTIAGILRAYFNDWNTGLSK